MAPYDVASTTDICQALPPPPTTLPESRKLQHTQHGCFRRANLRNVTGPAARRGASGTARRRRRRRGRQHRQRRRRRPSGGRRARGGRRHRRASQAASVTPSFSRWRGGGTLSEPCLAGIRRGLMGAPLSARPRRPHPGPKSLPPSQPRMFHRLLGPWLRPLVVLSLSSAPSKKKSLVKSWPESRFSPARTTPGGGATGVAWGRDAPRARCLPTRGRQVGATPTLPRVLCGMTTT